MGFKKEKRTLTLNGKSFKALIEEAGYTKIAHTDTKSHMCTDICEGSSSNFGPFIAFICDDEKAFGYIPKADYEGIQDMLAGGDFEGKFPFPFNFKMKKNQEGTRDYCIVEF